MGHANMVAKVCMTLCKYSFEQTLDWRSDHWCIIAIAGKFRSLDPEDYQPIRVGRQLQWLKWMHKTL